MGIEELPNVCCNKHETTYQGLDVCHISFLSNTSRISKMDTKYFTYMLENEDIVPAMMMMMVYPLPRSYSQHQHR